MAIKKHESELGFGSKTSSQKDRLINKDGTFNIHRIEKSRWESLSVYHALISMSWLKFNTIIIIYFIVVNIFFALLYYFTGTDGLAGVQAVSEWDKFWEAFFFSTQTISTVGFGRISPLSHTASIIAAIEGLLGLLGFAIVTGLLYGRFSQPKAKLLFSKNAIIAPFKEGKAFQFRIANKLRNSQLTDMNCRVTVAKYEIENGQKVRRFRPLELELSQIVFFPMTWTINHPIDENSPIYGMTEKDFEESDTEFLILLNGFDDTFSQNVNVRYSYTYKELIYGAKFVSVFSDTNKGKVAQDMNKLSDYETVKF